MSPPLGFGPRRERPLGSGGEVVYEDVAGEACSTAVAERPAKHVEGNDLGHLRGGGGEDNGQSGERESSSLPSKGSVSLL